MAISSLGTPLNCFYSSLFPREQVILQGQGLPFLPQSFPQFLSPPLYSSASAGNRYFCFENSFPQQLLVVLALREPGFPRALASVQPAFTLQLFSAFGPCARILEGVHISSHLAKFLSFLLDTLSVFHSSSPPPHLCVFEGSSLGTAPWLLLPLASSGKSRARLPARCAGQDNCSQALCDSRFSDV